MIPKAEFDKIEALKSVGIDSDWATCLHCKAVWEPFHEVYVRDPVCAEPCDNCAFRPGSPEQADPERWRLLIASLKPEQSYTEAGRFYCHKGVPIDMTKGPGNFLFPRKTVTMDGEPVCQPDGTVLTTEDVSKMRTCSGYLRMLWSRTGVYRNPTSLGSG